MTSLGLMKTPLLVRRTREVKHEDNEGAVRLANSRVRSARSKHIGLRYHLIRNGVKERRIVVNQLKTEGHNADIPTKPTSVVSFAKRRWIICGL